ncbi:MAG: hypothetical protein KAX38_03435, partial [Candidatus Krumholzibacteria bacterium]|nr:hypothetical protein [Candidatus Krumholzibacteria bacterium]
VLQLSPSFDWDYEPKEPEKGLFAFNDLSHGFGRISSPRPGLKEFLVSDFSVLDEESDPADFVVGATHIFIPPFPWDMVSDPWTDPSVDNGKTGEYGSIVESSAPARWIIDCVDGSKYWEITSDLDKGRYYFYETWFQPDLEWAHSDTADIYLHIYGKPEPKDIEELHLLFRMVDDDTLGPVFSDFSPEIVPAGTNFNITCMISDPSGVYDDNTGSAGQGVYLLWDTDGSLINGAYEVQMSSIGGGYYRTDSQIGGQPQGTEVLYKVFACDNDLEGGNSSDRSRSSSSERIVQIVGSMYLVDEPSSLYPSSVYPGQEDVSLHIELNNPVSTYFTLDTTSSISFSDSVQTVTAFLANRTRIYEGASHFPISFEPVTIPPDFSVPDTFALVLDLHGTYFVPGLLRAQGMDFEGAYDQMPYNQNWVASTTNMLVMLEPLVIFEAHAIPSLNVHPGETGVELIRLEVTNESQGDVLLDSLVVANVTTGNSIAP